MDDGSLVVIALPMLAVGLLYFIVKRFETPGMRTIDRKMMHIVPGRFRASDEFYDHLRPALALTFAVIGTLLLFFAFAS